MRKATTDKYSICHMLGSGFHSVAHESLLSLFAQYMGDSFEERIQQQSGSNPGTCALQRAERC